jgi:hypothetical protein
LGAVPDRAEDDGGSPLAAGAQTHDPPGAAGTRFARRARRLNATTIDMLHMDDEDLAA